ncbi:MAG: hypothetical protein JO144_11165 [Actinobacteria bacterium]|nr:hypothetical protein [Actinomycetota bacterium]
MSLSQASRRVLFSARRGGAAILTAVLALLGMSLTAPAAHAAGSYTITNWTQPSMYNVRIISNGSTFSAGVSGTITSLTGGLTFTTQPSGMRYRAYLCMDSGDTQCYDISPGGIYGIYSHSWNYSVQPAETLSALTTSFHLAVYVDDGSTGGTLQALKPYQYLMSRSAVINYS